MKPVGDGSEADQVRLSYGRTPLREPPELQDGQARRPMRRVHGETQAQAIERAKAMPWWRAVVSKVPACTRAMWVWTIDERRAV